MMNLRRAAVFMVVFALAAMAQDYTLTGPLSHRMTTGENASLAERATLTVPAETEVKVQVLSGIHSQINHVNDPVAREFFLRHPWLDFTQPGPRHLFWLLCFAPILVQTTLSIWWRRKRENRASQP